MIRTAMAELEKWKAKKRRNPLIIRGARQVGKTWLMKEFGAAEYRNVVYINFDNNERMKNLFEGGLEIERLIYPLSFFEFMEAMGRGQYAERLQKGDF